VSTCSSCSVITDFRDKLVRELSTGSRRIVDLACVLAHGPSVLLLDEPSSGIAQREAEALGPLLLRIREQTGATLLVIEHDVPLLLGIADRVVALDLGEVVADGAPDDVVNDPAVVRSLPRHNRSGDRTERNPRHVSSTAGKQHSTSPAIRTRGNHGMGMQQAPQRPKRSPWVFYGPIIGIVVVVIIVAAIIGVSGSDDNKKGSSGTSGAAGGVVTQSGTNGVPLFYTDAKAKGEVDKHTWQDNCDTSTGRVAIPILDPPPCTEKLPSAGASSPGVTADTIKIGYYIAKPDPIFDTLAKQAGAYDPPENSVAGFKQYVQLYSSVYNLYGRKIQLVKIQGTGTSSDAVAARADADKGRGRGRVRRDGWPGPGQAVR